MLRGHEQQPPGGAWRPSSIALTFAGLPGEGLNIEAENMIAFKTVFGRLAYSDWGLAAVRAG